MCMSELERVGREREPKELLVVDVCTILWSVFGFVRSVVCVCLLLFAMRVSIWLSLCSCCIISVQIWDAKTLSLISQFPKVYEKQNALFGGAGPHMVSEYVCVCGWVWLSGLLQRSIPQNNVCQLLLIETCYIWVRQ